MLIATWHFSFTVSDLDRSTAFYRDVVGLELVHRQEQANAYTRKLSGFAGARLRLAQFRVPGAQVGHSRHVIELVEYLTPRGEKVDTRTINPGTAHLAFEVEDIQAEYNRLSRLGVNLRSAPVAIEAGINKGGYTFFFSDPDDITLEMIQPPPGTITQAAGQGRPESVGAR